jgi:hypothetical protein
LQSRSRERGEKRRLLSDGSLRWESILLVWFSPLVYHGLGGFFLEEEDERE